MTNYNGTLSFSRTFGNWYGRVSIHYLPALRFGTAVHAGHVEGYGYFEVDAAVFGFGVDLEIARAPKIEDPIDATAE